MRVIMALLVLSVYIWSANAMAAQSNFTHQNFRDRQLQVDRYTGYKTNATIEESNPLLVITQINFPSNVQTVYEAIEHALQHSGYRVDWRQSAEAYDIFSELGIPMVHRKLNLMTLKDALATLSGEAWQLLVDSVNRKLVIQLHGHVPWQIANNPNDSDLYNPQSKGTKPLTEQAETNYSRVDSTMPTQVASTGLPDDSSGLALKSPESNIHIADGDILVNSATDYELTARDVHFAKAGMPIPDNNADLYDEMPTIHRAQYIPGYVEPYNTELSEQGEHTSYKRRDVAEDLWSVQPVIKAKESVGSLEEAVIVHYSSISVQELIEILIPEGWVVHYEVSDAVLKQKLVSHAESSRRNALYALFKELNLKALFYPGQAVVLVAEKEPSSFDYSNSIQFNATDSQSSNTPIEAASNASESSNLQPEVETILQNAKMIKNLMKEMEPGLK